VQNGISGGVVRSNVLPSTGTNTNVKPLCHHDPGNSNAVPADPNRIPADPNHVPRNSNRIPRDFTTDAPKPSPVPPAPGATDAPTIPKPETPEILGFHSTSPTLISNPTLSNLIKVDPGLFRNIRPNIGNMGAHLGGGQTGNSGSPSNTITVPPGANKHIDPLPGERRIAVPPPSPGITHPGNSGPGGSAGDVLGNLSSLLSGIGGSGGGESGAASGVEAAAPVEAPAPAPASDPVAASPAAPAEAQAKDVLDVELTDVRLVEEGSLERNVGPRYRLYYRNNGNVEAPKFHVSVAVDVGLKLTEKAELVTVEAVGLKPGKTQTVDVRLPVEVLKMAIDYEGQPAPFNAFVALIDSDNDLAETNEEDNILVFSRDKIQSVKQ
jgi:hypothetical protein